MKNLLLQLQDEPRWEAAMEEGLTLARSMDAHLDVLIVIPYGIGLAFDGFGGVYVLAEVIKEAQERSLEIRATVEQRLKREGLSWTLDLLDGSREAIVLARAPLHDLIVVNRHSHTLSREKSATPYLGALLYNARSPVFICGDGDRRIDQCGTALVAWNGSAEAAFAVRQSIGLLKTATRVVVLRIEEAPAAYPDTEVMHYLSRYGIAAELDVKEASDGDPMAVIAAQADSLGAFIVMGGYGHSRFGEYVFGGATRSVLRECPSPVVVAH